MVKSLLFSFLPLGEIWKCLPHAKVMCRVVPLHSLPGSVFSHMNPSEVCLSVCCEAMISLYLFSMFSHRRQLPVPNSPPSIPWFPAVLTYYLLKFYLGLLARFCNLGT